MKIITTLFALALGATFTFAAEEGAKKPEGDKPKMNPEEVFKKKDANSDNKLSKEEFLGKQKDPEKVAKAEKAFTAKDKDKDGSLSKEEFTATGPAKKKEA
jgi:hypothetical protein